MISSAPTSARSATYSTVSADFPRSSSAATQQDARMSSDLGKHSQRWPCRPRSLPGLAWRQSSVGGTPLTIRALCRPHFVADHATVGLVTGREPTRWSAIHYKQATTTKREIRVAPRRYEAPRAVLCGSVKGLPPSRPPQWPQRYLCRSWTPDPLNALCFNANWRSALTRRGALALLVGRDGQLALMHRNPHGVSNPHESVRGLSLAPSKSATTRRREVTTRGQEISLSISVTGTWPRSRMLR